MTALTPRARSAAAVDRASAGTEAGAGTKPAGGAVARVGSPPPTSTICPALAPATTRVWIRYCGPSTDSAAAAVSSLVVEAVE